MRYLIAPSIIAVFSILVIGAALRLDLSPALIVGESMQPRVFPITLMVINLVLALILAFQYRDTTPVKVPFEGAVTWGSVALFGLFYLLTVYVDMLIAMAVVVFLMALLWGERRLPVALAVALVSPFAIFILFDLVLRVRFPRGLFTNWYYG